VIEPARGEDAPENYLNELKELCSEIGAVLIFDEITSGFRSCVGGIHKKYKVYPDIAVFAKSIANGYAMSVIMGTEKVMESSQKTFISSTNWTDSIGPSAAIATIRKYIRTNTDIHINNLGNKVKDIWLHYARKNKINISISGLPSLASFSFNSNYSNELNTVFTIEMLKEGFLAFRQFKPSFAHNEKIIDKYAVSVKRTFEKISADPECKKLATPKHHQGFTRLTKE